VTLPPAREIVAELRRAIDATDERTVAPQAELTSLLLDLHATNVAQWAREDDARGANASDADVAAAKRAIDDLNLRRHGLIEALDAALANALTPSSAATPVTESPAMALDRLSVLVIRIHHTAHAGAPEDERSAARLILLEEQLDVLEQALDALVADVRAGRRSFLPYRQLKLYGR